MTSEASGPPRKTSFLARARQLYESDSQEAHRFRYGLLAFDLATVAFIVVSSFLTRTIWLEVADVVIGMVVAADFAVRIAISRERLRGFAHPATWADFAAVLSFLSPIVGEGAAFLRILRTLRLLRTYQILQRLRQDSKFFRRNEEAILATVNLLVFLFVMTAIVYETQHLRNDKINNYVDALYFTVTSLTTTGFGDITLEGSSGRLISVVIMICGVTLFLRLAQVLMRPTKVRFPCPTCGLQRHEPDAVHCKACGTLLNIPDEGD
ncbi:potassium channel family protein [Chthonobacter albigriseus]|uniref:potassium channel family protein n=1 Tax=Chthonobacter albigriseus TaxID=1683161 RepID=UPI0015EE5EAF|nr:potassium channel family protein [Chthonobacter albigriseus]